MGRARVSALDFDSGTRKRHRASVNDDHISADVFVIDDHEINRRFGSPKQKDQDRTFSRVLIDRSRCDYDHHYDDYDDDDDEDSVIDEDKIEKNFNKDSASSSSLEGPGERFDGINGCQKGDRHGSSGGLASSGKPTANRRKTRLSRDVDDADGCHDVIIISDSDDDDDGKDDDDDFVPNGWGRKEIKMENGMVSRKELTRTSRNLRNKRQKAENAMRGRQGNSQSCMTDESNDDFVIENQGITNELEARTNKGNRRNTRGRTVDLELDNDCNDKSVNNMKLRIRLRRMVPVLKIERKGKRSKRAKRAFDSQSSNFQNAVVDPCSRNLSLLETLEGHSLRWKRTNNKKGKGNTDDSQLDMKSKVCGICLSEEQEGTVRGTLDSCTHYFCFACIKEWSEVESRCPICKQRFTTISKPARWGMGNSLRKAVIRVPTHDQVYQPSEEELRNLLAPYLNVVCMVCYETSNQHVMLRCHICNTPTHTYCAGLGFDFPQGVWYCQTCLFPP